MFPGNPEKSIIMMLPNVLVPTAVIGRHNSDEGLRKGILSSSQFLVENLLSERSLSPPDSVGTESPPRRQISPTPSEHDEKEWTGKFREN